MKRIELKNGDKYGRMRNLKVQKRSQTGVKGVTWDSRIQKWVSRIDLLLETKYLGAFEDITEAVCYRLAAE